MADTHTHHDANPVPPFVGRLIVGLMLGALGIAGWAAWGPGGGPVKQPIAAMVEDRALILMANRDGDLIVRDAQGLVLADMTAEEAGFTSSIAKVIARDRTRRGLALDVPVIVSRHEDGQIRVTDPQTNWSTAINGFGALNAKAFAGLLAL